MSEEKNYQEWLDTVKKDHNALHYLSKEYLNKEICIFAYKQSPSSIR